MATTISAIGGTETPYSKKFQIIGDDSGVAGLYSIADFMTHLHEGPLKEALRRTLTTAIANFNIDQVEGSRIRIYRLAHSVNDALVGVQSDGLNIHWVSGANVNVAGLSVLATDTGENNAYVIIEIRLNHSTQG
jgi:hypothetical protein